MRDSLDHDGASQNGEHSGQDLDELLHAFCDGRLDESGRRRLIAMLDADDNARRRYIEFVHLCVGMSYPSAVGGGDVPGRSFDDSAKAADPTEMSGILQTLSLHAGSQQIRANGDSLGEGCLDVAAHQRKASRLSRLTFVAVTVGTAAVVVVAAWLGLQKGPVQVGKQLPPVHDKVKTANSPVAPSRKVDSDKNVADATYVARIVKASSDFRMGELASPIEFLVRVRSGDRMHITTGLVELEFYSGARLILHGPAVFTPTGVASGHLEAGSVTGEVANGNFRLMTPAAEVIDLGTAFGVTANAAVGTDVVVFDGRVQVVSLSEGGRAGESLDMTEGMAARFRVDGSTEYGLKTDAAQFKRHVASGSRVASENEICLIDVIAGGDGLGARLAGAIDPLTGQKDYGEREQGDMLRTRISKGQYSVSPWNAIIDGVFIPSRRGGQTSITSLDYKIDLPASNGQTWGPIWARRKDSLAEAFGQDFYWGDSATSEREGGWLKDIAERLKEARNGLVGIHANVGITFDLQAVRLRHRRGPTEFRAAVVNVENYRNALVPPPIKSPPSASFHVFVDGKLQYERLGFRGEDGEMEFAVPLTAENRFLTVVSTDNGDAYYCDHVALIDPIIELAKDL